MAGWRGLGILIAGALIAGAGCGDDAMSFDAAMDGGGADAATDAADGAQDGGTACSRLVWDPADGDLTLWPDPAFVEDDPGTVTGKRLRFDPEQFADLLSLDDGLLRVYRDDLPRLDGFGINADAYFVFDADLDEAALPTTEDEALTMAGFVVLGETPRLEPAALELADGGETLFLSPLRPLPEAARVAAFVTGEVGAALPGCVESSDPMAARLASPDADAGEAITALTDLGVIDNASELIGLTVFPTQSIGDDSLAVAEDIAGSTVEPSGEPTCVTDTAAGYVRCDARLPVGDYRGADGVVEIGPAAMAEPTASYDLPVTAWIPSEGTGPFPTLVFGHGLGGDRNQAARLARIVAPLGIATVAAPALFHGAHPTNPGGTQQDLILNFFAIDPNNLVVEPLVMRDHFRQSVYDRLHLTRYLESGPDIDNDGVADIDTAQIGYFGASLGALMGPELLTLTEAYPVAVLAMASGRLSLIARESETIAPLLSLLLAGVLRGDDLRRYLVAFQTAADRGDAASYAASLTDGTLISNGERSINLLMGIALGDEILPNSSSWAVARAARVEIVPEVLEPVAGLDVTGMPPVSGNRSGGAVTSTLLQFDVIRELGMVVPVTHENLAPSDVGIAAWLPFFESYWADGVATTIDPYEAVGLMHGGP
jgi:dienelactone hydrolase